MILSGHEMQLLEGMIGKKAERVLVPLPVDSVSKPVETVVVFSPDSGLLIDSCYRAQKPVETPTHYPQLRVRLIHDIPKYVNGRSIDLSEQGEIVRSVEVTSEEVLTNEDTASYTKSIRIEFTGAREVTITRETFRTSALAVYEKEPTWDLEGEAKEGITTSVQRM